MPGPKPTAAEVTAALAVLDTIVASEDDAFQASVTTREQLHAGAEALAWLNRQADFMAWLSADNADSVNPLELPTPLTVADLRDHLRTHHDTDVQTSNPDELWALHAEYHHNALTLVWDSPNAHTHPADDTPEPDPVPKYWAANDEAPATAWFYQTGNRWVAVVAENENEAEWFEDATTDRKTWPIMRTHPIKHVPTTGMLVYRTAKGREVWEREGEEVVVVSGPPTLEAAIDRAKREILDEVQAGRFVGSQITCFADLHDHMDANTLGGLADDDFPLDGDEQIEFGNALQAALDEWIKNNGMTDGIEARNDRWLTVGELRRHLARFPDDTPITATNAGGVDYLNVVCASNPYESGEPSLVLDTRDDFDVRQF